LRRPRRRLIRLTDFPWPTYSDGMISEFHDLSDKIDRLAALTQSLRRENAQLRQSNAMLSAENVAFMERLGEAQRRLEALLAKLPAPDDDGAMEPASTSTKDAQ
jgi:cell division protein ZapB